MRDAVAGLAGFFWTTAAMIGSGVAGPVQLYDRSSLTSQTIIWSAYGSPGTMISTPMPLGFGAETVAVNSSSGNAELRQEGTDFRGNFSVGDALLSLPDGDKSDAFSLDFTGAPVTGLGAQIEPVSGYTGAFTGLMKLYGVNGGLLGAVSIAGDASTAEDGSAVFLGASSSVPIGSAVFFVEEGNAFIPLEGDLAINELSLQEDIPEPPAALLLIPAMLALIAVRRVIAARQAGRG